MKALFINGYIIDAPIIDILQKLKSELTNDKLSVVENKSGWIRVTCPSHAGGHEEHPSCGVYCGDGETEYGFMHCFTCGESGHLWHFVAQCFDSSDDFGKEWLVSNFGHKNDFENIELEEIVLPTRSSTKEYLDESILDTFQSWHPYMETRKLSKKVCELFKIKYDPKTECIVFPVYDENNKLWMLTRRSVKNKHFYIDKDKEKPVYLINYIRDKGIKEVTVVESQINALTCMSWGIPAVATFGCNITPKQIDILNKSGLKHIYICYDGDAAGKKGTKKLIEKLNKDILVDVIVMDQGKDVNDISEERFNQLPIINSVEWIKNGNKN